MRGVTPIVFPALQGRRILVVEDEYMIAQEVADMLAAVGAEPLGPVPGVTEAMQLIDSENWIDGALLDVNLHNQTVWPVVDALRARSVPVVLVTGYDVNVIPAAYATLPRYEKPATRRDLASNLARAMTTGARAAPP